MAPPELQFWFEFASTYSYLAALPIEPLAAAASSCFGTRTSLPAQLLHTPKIHRPGERGAAPDLAHRAQLGALLDAADA